MSFFPKTIDFESYDKLLNFNFEKGAMADRLSATRPSTEGQYRLRPNSAYFIRFDLRPDGMLDVKHHWYRQNNPGWDHEKLDSIPKDSATPDVIEKEYLPDLVKAYIKGTNDGSLDKDQWVERDATAAKCNFNWVSWIVVVFDHRNWQFEDNADPVLISTQGNPNHSYFEGELVPNGPRKNAYAFVNLMCADEAGNPLKVGKSITHKFDLVMQVQLANQPNQPNQNSYLRVLVDPTGTNNGPSGGGRYP